MSIKTAIERTIQETLHFKNKCYSNINLKIEKISLKDFFKKHKVARVDDTYKRIYLREFSIDGADIAFIYSDKNSKIITLNMIRELFNDIGFNTDVQFSETHYSDINLVYNIGGTVVPFYNDLIRLLYKKKKALIKLFITKLGLGKQRLHCRFFHLIDGNWLLTSHIDRTNWFDFSNPPGIFSSHFIAAKGNYRLGEELMEFVNKKVVKSFKLKRQINVDINKIYQKHLKIA